MFFGFKLFGKAVPTNFFLVNKSLPTSTAASVELSFGTDKSSLILLAAPLKSTALVVAFVPSGVERSSKSGNIKFMILVTGRKIKVE